MNKVTSAIVLCAGRGKRLRPHTDTTPKPLLPVAGKPTLDFVFESLQHAGVERVVLVTHHLGEQVEQYAELQRFFPPTNVVCVQQGQLAGTADAAIAALDAKPEWFTTPFILTASDYLVPTPFYKALVDAYASSDTQVAVSLKRLPEEELSSRSSVRFDDNGDVLEVVEKPAKGEAPSNLSANLVFILPADIIPAIRKVAPSERGEKEVQTAVNVYISQNKPGCGLEQDTPAEWQPELM